MSLSGSTEERIFAANCLMLFGFPPNSRWYQNLYKCWYGSLPEFGCQELLPFLHFYTRWTYKSFDSQILYKVKRFLGSKQLFEAHNCLSTKSHEELARQTLFAGKLNLINQVEDRQRNKDRYFAEERDIRLFLPNASLAFCTLDLLKLTYIDMASKKIIFPDLNTAEALLCMRFNNEKIAKEDLIKYVCYFLPALYDSQGQIHYEFRREAERIVKAYSAELFPKNLSKDWAE